MNPVPLHNLEVALTVHLLVHNAVEDEQKGKKASQDEVVDPFDAPTDAEDHGPVGHAMGFVLEAVRDREDLVGSLPLRIILISLFLGRVVLVDSSEHAS